jgi:hypothetical protein
MRYLSTRDGHQFNLEMIAGRKSSAREPVRALKTPPIIRRMVRAVANLLI